MLKLEGGCLELGVTFVGLNILLRGRLRGCNWGEGRREGILFVESLRDVQLGQLP